MVTPENKIRKGCIYKLGTDYVLVYEDTTGKLANVRVLSDGREGALKDTGLTLSKQLKFVVDLQKLMRTYDNKIKAKKSKS